MASLNSTIRLFQRWFSLDQNAPSSTGRVLHFRVSSAIRALVSDSPPKKRSLFEGIGLTRNVDRVHSAERESLQR